MRTRGIGALVVVAALACGPAPGYEPETPTSPETLPQEVAATRSLPAGPGAVETACDRAKRLLTRARELERDGWVHRPLRLSSQVGAACPSLSDAALSERLKRLATPGGNATELEQALAAARARGADGEARRIAGQLVTVTEQRLHARARIVHRPTGRVVGVSADASAVVLADDDDSRSAANTTLTLVDGRDGRPTHVIATGHRVAHADVSARRLVTSGDGAVRVWSLDSAALERELRWTNEGYNWAALIDEGRRVVALGGQRDQGSVRIYDLASGDSSTHIAPAGSGELRDGRWLGKNRLAARDEHRIYVFDLSAKKVLHQIEVAPAESRGYGQSIVSLDAASDVVAAATYEGQLLVWRLGQAEPFLRITADREPAVSLSADGKRLHASFESGFRSELRTYDLQSGEAVRSRPLQGEWAFFASHGERVVVASREAIWLEDGEGRALWPEAPAASEIEAIALSHGLAVTRERRDNSDSFVELSVWYGGKLSRFEQGGYRSDVFAISPSGRQVAAVLSSQAYLWDVETGRERQIGLPDARGFPDTLLFADATTLRLIYERPAASYEAKAPYDAWVGGVVGELDGFYGTAVSAQGKVVTSENGKITLAEPRTVLAEKGGGFAFSGDGKLIFVGTKSSILWFDAEGRRLGEQVVGCDPGTLGVDQAGSLVAFSCGYRQILAFEPPTTLRKLEVEGGSVESVRVAPSGTVAVHGKTDVRFYGRDMKLRATLELRNADALVTTPDGRVMFWGKDPAWLKTASCAVAHRTFPIEACLDKLMDDTIVEALLTPLR